MGYEKISGDSDLVCSVNQTSTSNANGQGGWRPVTENTMGDVANAS